MRRNGFTLIELMIVIVIVALLAAMAVPRVGESIPNQQVEAAARRIAADLELAPRTAIFSGAARSAQFANARSTYTVDVGDALKRGATVSVDLEDEFSTLVEGVSFDGARTLTFDRYGKPSSGGSVTIGCGSHRRVVTVEAGSGRITLGTPANDAVAAVAIGGLEQ